MQFTQKKRQFKQKSTQMKIYMIQCKCKVSNEGSEKMKHFNNIIKKVIKWAAAVSSETTSATGLYQPKTPKALIKCDKKKVD